MTDAPTKGKRQTSPRRTQRVIEPKPKVKTKPPLTQAPLVVTRQFGLTPLPRCPTCNALGLIRKRAQDKPELICPVCQLPLSNDPSLLPTDLFQNFAKLVNVLIRRGLHRPSQWFRQESLTAVKRFHDQLKTDPQVDKVFKEGKLHNRLRRCAAQYAYFSIREYKQRKAVIQVLGQVLVKQLTTDQQECLLTNPKFPTKDLVRTSRQALFRALGDSVPLDSVYLGNMLRHARNLVYQMLLAQDAPLRRLKESTVPEEPLQIRDVLAQWLWEDFPALAKSFARGLSRLLTQRVKKLVAGQGPLWRKGTFDEVINQIYAFSGQKVVSAQGALLLTENGWQKARKAWRDHLVQTLLTTPAFFLFEQVLTCVAQTPRTPTKQTFQWLLHKSFPRFWYKGNLGEDWAAFLIYHLTAKHWTRYLTNLTPIVRQIFLSLCQELAQAPEPWLKRPVFQSQAIPLGLDDNYVYQLGVESDPLNSEEQTNRNGQICVRLTYAPRQTCEFQLNTPQRFFTLQDQAYRPQKPILLKRTAGGAIVLALPFLHETGASTIDQGVPAPDPPEMALNVDLGLKTFATCSITQGLVPLQINPRTLSAEDWQTCFEGCRIEDFEIARFFLDKAHLGGKAAGWFTRAPSKMPPSSSSLLNFKRRLTNLQAQAQKLKSKLDRYRNAHRPQYRHHKVYARLRRDWKRVWKKIRNIHEELTRQLATRLVHLALHYKVPTIRFEDLKWAQHGRKEQVGTWLATWQVHWFHGQIIRRTKELCARYGIRVDLVYAVGTSQRCSSCGHQGIRKGKLFRCPQCGRQLDSDLNAARNIAYAPLSPVAIRDWGEPP